MPQETFISEPITPDAGTFDLSAMARAEPGLPTGFTWQNRHYAIVDLVLSWKSNGRQGEAAGYLRRHWFKVRTDTNQIMTLYCLRQAKDKRKRWWIYSLESSASEA